MTLKDAIEIGSAVVLSLGSGAALVVALSSWLGKVWAERLMERERQKHATELEQLRSQLTLTTESKLAALRTELEVAKEALVREHTDRVEIYRSAIDLIADIAAKVEMVMIGRRSPLNPTEQYEFEAERLRVYAYLAMHAPQVVMDAHDALSDAILSIIYDGANLTWKDFRDLSTRFLNEVRKDVGIRPEPIEYRGVR